MSSEVQWKQALVAPAVALVITVLVLGHANLYDAAVEVALIVGTAVWDWAVEPLRVLWRHVATAFEKIFEVVRHLDALAQWMLDRVEEFLCRAWQWIRPLLRHAWDAEHWFMHDCVYSPLVTIGVFRGVEYWLFHALFFVATLTTLFVRCPPLKPIFMANGRLRRAWMAAVPFFVSVLCAAASLTLYGNYAAGGMFVLAVATGVATTAVIMKYPSTGEELSLYMFAGLVAVYYEVEVDPPRPKRSRAAASK